MDRNNLVKRNRPDATPAQMRPSAAIALAGSLTVVAAVLLYWLLTWRLGLPGPLASTKGQSDADSKLLLDASKVALGLAAGIGAVVALTLSYRRHRIEESQSRRDDQRLLLERFDKAADHLGHEQPSVRLAGVYALAHVADDWDEQRQACIDVLCAYLRLQPANEVKANEDREIRQTIVRLITDHLRIDRGDPRSWQGHDLDFSGAVFDGVFDFSLAKFSGGTVRFDRAIFLGDAVDFAGAQVSGGVVRFVGATFSSANLGFNRAEFVGGRVRFDRSRFVEGVVRFSGARFAGSDVSFDKAEILDALLRFDNAEFSSGKVDMRTATWERPPEFD